MENDATGNGLSRSPSSTTIDNNFQVDYQFSVCFTEKFWSNQPQLIGDLLKASTTTPCKMVLAVDANLMHAGSANAEYLDHIIQCIHADERLGLVAAPVSITAGEKAKANWDIVEQLGAVARRHNICRHSAIIAIGGGAVLDAVGLAAALIHRGIRLIRLPTTSLGQADSGLGVKNAINGLQTKNFYGTFVPPYAVINDHAFIKTLPTQQWRCGLAEALKVALIKDSSFFRRLIAAGADVAKRNESTMATIIAASARLHLQHICNNGDPFERGSARPLDFGHWSAHWLEMNSHTPLLHGEAVAIGVALDALYAAQNDWLRDEEAHAAITFLLQAGFHLMHPLLTSGMESDTSWLLLQGLEEFRQHLGGALTVAMPDGLGAVQDCHSIDSHCLRTAIQQLTDRSTS